MFFIINILAGFLGTRLGLMVALPLAGAGMLAVVLGSGKVRRQHPPLPVISLLREVRYMQELEVVQYHSQHVMMLGDPGLLQEMALQAARDTLKPFSSMERLRVDMIRADELLANARNLLSGVHDSLGSLYATIANCNTRYDLLSMKEDQLADYLQGQAPEYVGDHFSAAFSKSWQAYHIDISVEKSSSTKKSAKKRRKLRNAFRSAIASERKALRKEIRRHESVRSTAEKVLNLDEKEKTVRERERQYDRVRLRYQSAQTDLLQLRQVAYGLRDSAVASLGRGNTHEKVKVIALVPASLGFHIDMEKVAYEQLGEENSFLITVDSLVAGRPLIALDQSRYFETGGNGLALKTRDGGLYREVFEQIRMGIRAIEFQIHAQARKMGLVEEGCFAAEEYFQNTLRSLGHEVEVRFRSAQCPCLNRTSERSALTDDLPHETLSNE